MNTFNLFRHGAIGQRPTAPLRRDAYGALHALWRVLHNMGQRRAAGHLEFLARRYDHGNPALARHLRQTAADCRTTVQRACEVHGTGVGQ